jgi:squalene-hopene/tetraprenyl-beta-curcumene cyclase
MRNALCGLPALAGLVCLATAAAADDAGPLQYDFGEIKIAVPSGEEPRREKVDLAPAVEYLERGSAAWFGQRKCVTCHTNGTYGLVRPLLVAKLGPPPAEMRESFVGALAAFAKKETAALQKGTLPAQVVYTAAALATWDAHLGKGLSAETKDALRLMFSIQREDGAWGALNCWPPLESDSYHLAAVAALAVAAAPNYRAELALAKDRAAEQLGVERLLKYLRTEPPPHDYARLWLLWAAVRMPELLPADERRKLAEGVWKQQREDGGWSIRTFAAPEAWGNGNRAERIRAEPDFAAPPSDGHMTGLALVVLREAGADPKDDRFARGLAWLRANQRASGRWWTRSLNTDGPHYITYSGTAFPVLALVQAETK